MRARTRRLLRRTTDVHVRRFEDGTSSLFPQIPELLPFAQIMWANMIPTISMMQREIVVEVKSYYDIEPLKQRNGGDIDTTLNPR